MALCGCWGLVAGAGAGSLYGLLILSILTNLYVLGVPLALFRLYILVAALVSLLCCLRWAAASRRLREARLYAWVLRLAAVLAAVLCAELWEKPSWPSFLVSCCGPWRLCSSLVCSGTSCVGPGVGCAQRVSRHAALLGRHTALVVQRLAWLGDVLIGVVLLSVLLMTWQVYDNPAEAITGLLSVHATIGSQQITIGLVMLAIAALGVSYLASWMLQTLLTENVLARRHVDTGVSLSVSRLLHYALVSVGFVLALVVLGVDLTKMTLLVSALGVGIGFGLQTIVNNFVCGLILLLERPLRVGDTIELGGQLAKIAKIGLRSTTVRTADQADDRSQCRAHHQSGDELDPDGSAGTERYSGGRGVWVGHCACHADAERVRAGPPRSAAKSRAAGVVPQFRGQRLSILSCAPGSRTSTPGGKWQRPASGH